MKVVLTIIVTAIFALPTLAQNVTSGAPNVNLPGVRLRLVLADNKTSFRIGEAVKLFLEFTADRGGYRVEVIPDRQQPTNDKIVVSPDGGVFHWLEESMGGTYSRDYFGLEELTSAPLRVPLVLNDTLRFDQPGQYTVKVLTTRVEGRSNDQTDPHNPSRPIELETNSVSFEMLPMSETDEQKEGKTTW